MNEQLIKHDDTIFAHNLDVVEKLLKEYAANNITAETAAGAIESTLRFPFTAPLPDDIFESMVEGLIKISQGHGEEVLGIPNVAGPRNVSKIKVTGTLS